MPRTGQPAHRHVGAVSRALDVLDALADGVPELGTNEIARRTGINASTVSRLLATLAGAGLVEFVPESGRYRLGLRLVQLGNAVLERLEPREVARRHLEALVVQTGETATLSAPGDGDAITIDFVQGPSSVQSVAQIGRRSVAHATATGKMMLALDAIDLPPGRLPRYTARTVTSRRALAAELEQVRARGWARSVGEREADLNAIAALVLDGRGRLVAVVGLQGPAPRFGAQSMKAALQPLRARAEAVSVAFGWQPST